MKALRNDDRKIYHVEQTLDLLQTISNDSRFKKMKEILLENEKIDSKDRKEMDNMSSLLLDAVENEGVQKGIEQGMPLGELKKLIKMVCKKLRKNKSIDTIAFELEEEYTTIEKICNAAGAFAPDYNEDKVYDILKES